MKKLSLLFVLLALSVSCFASGYYEVGGSSSLFSVLLIALGVFNLVLLYKVWLMTNDVRKIKDTIVLPESDVLKKVRDLYLCGKVDEARDILCFDYLSSLRSYFSFYGLTREIFIQKRDDLNKLYSKRFSKIGSELPDSLKNLSYDDYENFFGE